MRHPVNWFVLALSLGLLVVGRTLQVPRPEPVVIERTQLEPKVAAAVPAAFRRHAELEFGYVETDL
jgi:hypothetical protein